MHISGLLKVDIGTGKANIVTEKVDIETKKVDIEALLSNIEEFCRNKIANHEVVLFDDLGRDTIFGRSIVERITGLKSSRASEIINLMLKYEIIEPVNGFGKGKYRFR